MGVVLNYGILKYWFYGSTFDGMRKNNSAKANFGVGASPNDFIFPVAATTGKAAALVDGGGARATATANIKLPVKSIAAGQASGIVIRKIGGTRPNYGQLKSWIYGASSFGLIKNNPGSQLYWPYGNTEGTLAASTQGAIAFGQASASATLKIKLVISGRSFASASCKVIKQIGGAVDPKGGQKYWGTGQSTGLTFLALADTLHVINRNKFADQTLWYFGLPTPDIFTKNFASQARMIIPQQETKRSASGWPSSIKIISGAYPAKRSSVL